MMAVENIRAQEKGKPIAVLAGASEIIHPLARLLDASSKAKPVTLSQITRREEDISAAVFHNVVKCYNSAEDGRVRFVLHYDFLNSKTFPIENHFKIFGLPNGSSSQFGGETTLMMGYLQGGFADAGFGGSSSVRIALPPLRELFGNLTGILRTSTVSPKEKTAIYEILENAFRNFFAGKPYSLERAMSDSAQKLPTPVKEKNKDLICSIVHFCGEIEKSLVLDFPIESGFEEVREFYDLYRYPLKGERISAYAIGMSADLMAERKALAVAESSAEWLLRLI